MTIPVKEFATTEEMYASAKAVNLRMFPPRPRWVSYTPVEPLAAAAVPAPPATVEVKQYVKPTYRIPSIAHLTPKQLAVLAKRVGEHRKKRGTGLVKALTADDGFDGLGVVKVNELVLLVETITGIRKTEILSQQRCGPAVKARQIVMWLAMRFTLRSSPTISGFIGGRDHTTVLHAVRKLNAVIAKIGRPTEDSPEAWARHLWRADWKRDLAPPKPLDGYWNIVVAPALSQQQVVS
jgi:hypothetical protein